MGWGPDNYSVALTDGKGVTHYGLHAWVQPSFADLINAGVMPDKFDFPKADFDAVIAALVSSFRDSMDGHWHEVLAKQGLSCPPEAST
jgi:hypothetical protein